VGATRADDFLRQANEYGQTDGDHASSRTDPDDAERLTGIYRSDAHTEQPWTGVAVAGPCMGHKPRNLAAPSGHSRPLNSGSQLGRLSWQAVFRTTDLPSWS
jgi:hypothetical protein